jgi:hypothetical protein
MNPIPERNHAMNEHQNIQPENPQAPLVGKREFLGKLGRWSGASIAAVIGGAAWLSSPGSAQAGWINRAGWVNRSGGWINGGGSWINGGGGWVNGGGSWINSGGGSWVNRGGGGWVNGGGGGWVNRRGGGGWINRR